MPVDGDAVIEQAAMLDALGGALFNAGLGNSPETQTGTYVAAIFAATSPMKSAGTAAE